MIKNYIKIAFRSFWRHKLFTLINVIGLSIGISAALVIYLIVNFDLGFDKFHKNGDRIYRVVTNFTFLGNASKNQGICGPLPWAVKSGVSGLDGVAPLYKLMFPDVFIGEKQSTAIKFKTQRSVMLTDMGYFEVFSYHWLAGSAKTALNKPYQVVLTSDQARLYFPGLAFNDMLGKTITYDTIKTTVTGIVKTQNQNTDLNFHDFISYSTILANKDLKAQLKLSNWGGTSIKSQLFIKLSATTQPLTIISQLNTILKRNSPIVNKDKTQNFDLEPLKDIHFDDYTTFDNVRVANKATLYGLMAIAAFLLLLGCINFINLTTAQSVQRAKEIGIRKTMGSSRKQLIYQFLGETFLITLMAVIISVALSPYIIKLFAGFIPAGVVAGGIQQSAVLLFLLGLTVVVGFLSGLYPAVVLSAYQPITVLKNQATKYGNQTRSTRLRKALTVSQFVIAQFFIMATMLVSKQIYYATHKPLGFKKDAVVMITAPYKTSQPGKNRVLLNKLRAIPQIQMVSQGNDAPSSENTSSTEATYLDGKKEIKLNIDEKFGDESYLKLYHIRLLAGRNLQPVDSDKALLANYTYAKLLGFNNPADAVGKQLVNFNGDTQMQIVGVVSDFHQESLRATIDPLVMRANVNGFDHTFHIALKPQSATGDEWQTAISAMQIAWKQIYPGEGFTYQFVDDSIAQFYFAEQQTSALLSWATGLSVFISCLGLLGLALYTTNQRTKEIGVRKVLGASVVQIVALLSSELVWLTVLAFVIVCPVAWYAMNRWMQAFADRTPISWWIFLSSGAGMLMAAMVTSGFQTVRAASANPVKSLRSE